MARVRGLHGPDLDGLISHVEVLALRALRAVVRAAVRVLGADGTPTVDDVAVIPVAWAAQVDAALLPAVEQVWTASATATAGAFADAGQPVSAAPTAAIDYLAEARNRLSRVGDDLWAQIRAQLVEGMTAGEGVQELAARIGQTAGLGEARALRIARTEVIAASNAASLATARSLGNGVVKEWLATPDDRTRPTHRAADGQNAPVGAPFTVGEAALMFPGDPTGPADECVNCRCSLAYSFGDDVSDDPLTAAAEVHTGAMVALVPSEADAARLAVDGGEPADQLHTTLLYLGEAAQFSPDARTAIVGRLRSLVEDAIRPDYTLPLVAEGFAVSVFNPPDLERSDGKDRDSCIVLGLGGDGLGVVRDMVADSVREVESEPAGFAIPEQHDPWVPHITLIYTDLVSLIEELINRTGPVVFDRIRVAFGGENVDIPLVSSGEPEGDGDDPNESAALEPDDDGDMDWDSFIAERIAAFVQSDQQLREYWIHGAGATKIRWGTDGDFTRCVRHLRKYVTDPEGLCAEYHHEATGMWPGDRRNEASTPQLADDTVVVEPVATPVEVVEEAAEDSAPTEIGFLPGEHWHAVMNTEGVSTGYRMFTPGALTWREPPFAFHWQYHSSAHGGTPATVQVGNVTRVERIGDEIHGWGTLDLASTEGREYGRRLVGGFARWVSIGLDESFRESDIEYVWPSGVEAADMLTTEPDELIISAGRIGELTAVSVPAQQEAVVEPSPELIAQFEIEDVSLTAAAVRSHDTPTTNVEWNGEANVDRLPSPLPIEIARAAYAWIDDSRAEDGMVAKDACKFPHHEVTENGVPGAANLKACEAVIGALHGARSEPDIPEKDRRGVYDHVARHMRDAGLTPPDFDGDAPAVVVAAGHTITIPDVPPAEWFTEPTDVEVTGALTVTDEGRVYGYLAPSGVAHRAFRNRRQEVPMGRVDYSRWMGGEAIVAGGRVVAGPITMDCGHMPPTESADPVVRMEHYDNTCSVVAQAAIGENAHGVWIAGALLPGVTAEQVTRMLACRLSGDWAPHPERPGWREFVAALLVPVPGFPMARSGPSVRLRDGALVASAVPVRMEVQAEPDESVQPEGAEAQVFDLRPALERLARGVGRDYNSRLAAIRDRVHRP